MVDARLNSISLTVDAVQDCCSQVLLSSGLAIYLHGSWAAQRAFAAELRRSIDRSEALARERVKEWPGVTQTAEDVAQAAGF